MIGEHLAIVTWARAYRIKCHCSKTEGVGHYTPYKQGDNCLQPASEIYQHFRFRLKATFERSFWEFCLNIYFGYFGLMLTEKMCFEFDSKRLITFLNYTRLYLNFCYFDFLGADFGF